MSQTIEWWPSPAKINLFLHICGRLPNGYHQLQTLFQLLDFGDEIGIELSQNSNIRLIDNIDGVSPEDNLIYKAANLLAPFRLAKNKGANIFLRKRIVMGGGLGGGSSNAATVMVALNQLWHCNLSQSDLQTLGLSLGADVPVFINGHSAFAEGVGEILLNTQIPSCYYVVATPNVHVSTASIFAHPDLPRNTPKIDFSHYRFDKTQNDCEKLVCKEHPEVANLLHRLIQSAPSRMTGTGASVFATFTSFNAAQKLLEQLPKDVDAFVAKGVDVSPLHVKLSQLHV